MNKKNYDEFSYPEIYLQSFELSKLVIKSTTLFPKPTRYVLGHKLEDKTLNFLLLLNKIVGPSGVSFTIENERQDILKELSNSLDEFRILLRMAREVGAYSGGQYFELNNRTQSIGKQIGGMLRACKTK